jgi:hypothetical protein
MSDPIGELSWDSLYDEYERVWRLWRQERVARIKADVELEVANRLLARIPRDVVLRALDDEYAVVTELEA